MSTSRSLSESRISKAVPERSAGSRQSIQVLLDTSFILTLVKRHRDPWAEIRTLIRGRVRILVMELVQFELERLSRKSSGETRLWAKTSLELLAKRRPEIVEHKTGPSDVDSSLIAHALTERTLTAIATVDREMRTVLAAQDVPVISPRSRHGLMSNGPGLFRMELSPRQSHRGGARLRHGRL